MKKKKKIFKRLKGFTLVELLAVIVILAIIMIIAIPAVLNTMESARRKTMLEFAQKVYLTGQRKFIEDKSFNNMSGFDHGNYIYSIKKDLDLSNTGDFDGYYIVWQEGNYINHHVFIWNKEFLLYKSNVDTEEITDRDITTLSEAIKSFESQGLTDADSIIRNADSTNKMLTVQMLAISSNIKCESDYDKTRSIIFADEPKNVIKICDYLKG